MNKSYYLRLICCGIFIFFFWGSGLRLGCEASGGFPFISRFLPNDYNSQPQNWSVCQDNRGIIYVANQEGLLTYDGAVWRAFDIPNRSVRSMAVGTDGVLYVGGKNEIGYMSADNRGDLDYHSLVRYLDESKRDFSTVWSAHAAPGGIYFRTSKMIMYWSFKTRRLNYWETGSIFLGSFVCRDRVYVQVRDAGLFRLTDGTLHKMPGCDVFDNEKIAMLAPFPGTKTDITGAQNQHVLLAVLRCGRFFLYDGKKTIPFSTGADVFLKKHQVYHGAILERFPGRIALGTRWGGLVIINSRGKVLRIFDKPAALPDNNIRYVFEDAQGNIWLALTRGLAKIEYASPLTVYGEESGLRGIVLSIVREPVENRLMVGTYTGLFSLDDTGRFRSVPRMTGQHWSLLPLKKTILAASEQGVTELGPDIPEITGERYRKIFDKPTFVLSTSRTLPVTVWAGGGYGLASLTKRENGRWECICFSNIQEPVRSIVETKEGNLWLGTLAAGVIKVDVHHDNGQSILTVTRFDSKYGLPGGEVYIAPAAGHVVFCTSLGVYRYDPVKNIFVPDNFLGPKFAGSDKGIGVFRLQENKNSHLFFHSGFQHFHAVPEQSDPGGKQYIVDATPFLRLPPEQANAIYADPVQSAAWFGTHEHLVCYDITFKKNYRRPFATILRKVVVNEKKVIYYGFISASSPPHSVPELPYSDRNLRFEFGAAFFEAEDRTRYQCFLEGYDNGWSDWNNETHRVYTNLDGGLYTFRVRARSVYAHTGREAAFTFRLFPPWYKSWWAYTLYGLLLLLSIYLTARLRSRKLRQEKQKLELLVKERTREIHKKNQLLETQAERLEKKSQTLKEMAAVKSCFLANISHEFRAPLSLIMGPLHHMLAREKVPAQKKQLEMMTRNSQHLLNLSNQLLDLSRFESGQMILQAGYKDIVVFLKGIMEAFDMASRQKELELSFLSDEDEVWLYFDDSKLEQVFGNLFFNIVRFISRNGRVDVEVRSHNGPGYIQLLVRVFGIGIPDEQLPHIFDRFYQLCRYECRADETSNIGLALAKELVNLHRGELDVKRLAEQSAEFRIRLPLGNSHLTPEEISEDTAALPVLKETRTTGSKISNRDISRLAQLAAAAVTNGESHPPEPTDEESAQPEEKGRMIILVVDDSVDAREYMCRSLESEYRVVEAANGSEGIRQAKKIIPDLVISDVIMPETDGIALCKEIKNDRKTSHIPVILLSARASEENILQGLESGADDYITKPFNSTLLKARIKNLIDLRRFFHLKMDREMTLQPSRISVSDVDREFIDDLKSTIEKNMANPDFNVEELGKRLYMSRATLYRKIHALSGQSPTQFIRAYRLKRAAQLLTDKNKNVTDIAFAVGFSSTAYFTKCFKEKFHQLPSLYQLSRSPSQHPSLS